METIKSVVGGIAKFAAFNLALILFVVAAPVIYLTVPFAVVIANPASNLWWLVAAYMVSGPVASAFGMILICHWSSFHTARLSGKTITEWRAANGGMRRTVWKAIGFMCLGLVGTVISETIFCIVFHFLIVPPNAVSYLVFFAMAPFAVYAPVILTVVIRRRRTAAENLQAAQWRAEYRQELLSKGMEVPVEYRDAHLNDAGYASFLTDLRSVWASKDASFLRTAGVQA
jgi:hypothetical protein